MPGMKIIQTFVSRKIIVNMAFRFFSWSSFFMSFLMWTAGPDHPGRVFLHPFHVSVVEVQHNASARTLEMTCKIFTDDFEKVLAKNYRAKVDLTNPPAKAAMDSLVKNYLFSHLSLRVNDRAVAFSYLGYEVDQEAAYGFIEVSGVAALSRLEVDATLMYDQFDDQMNIFHVTVGGHRKSTRLNYPDRKAVLVF